MLLSKWIFKQKRSRAQAISYYKDTFERTYAGKYTLADICRHGHIDESTFNPNSSRLSDYNEGKRAMALHILNMLNLNPNEYVGRFHIESSLSNDED